MRLIEYEEGKFINYDLIKEIHYNFKINRLCFWLQGEADTVARFVQKPYDANFRAEICCAHSPHNMPENPNLVYLKPKV